MRVEAWVVLILLLFIVLSVYDSRFVLIGTGSFITFVSMTLYQSHKKKNETP